MTAQSKAHTVTELLRVKIRRNPPTTIEMACDLAVRSSIAALGAAHSEKEIHAAVSGLAEGLFGEAFHGPRKSEFLIAVEASYRAALLKSQSPVGEKDQ